MRADLLTNERARKGVPVLSPCLSYSAVVAVPGNGVAVAGDLVAVGVVRERVARGIGHGMLAGWRRACPMSLVIRTPLNYRHAVWVP